MKKYTKFMGILLALVMLLALISVPALADQEYVPTTPGIENNTLTVSKKLYIYGENGDLALLGESYTFNYRLTEEKYVNNTWIKDGIVRDFSITVTRAKQADEYGNTDYYFGSVTLEGMPIDGYCSIEETSHPEIPGYRYAGETNAFVSMKERDSVEFGSSYSFRQDDCDITVSKTVEGSGASANDEFIFEIEYTFTTNARPQALEGGEAISVFAAANNYDDEEDFDNKILKDEVIDKENRRVRVTFKLKHGESITFDDAKKDSLFVIKEIDNGGYDSTTFNGNRGTAMEGRTDPLGTTVNFVNYKGSVETTNDLTVEKKWSDGNDRHAADSVTVQLYRNGQPYSLSLFGEVIDDGKAVLNAENNWSHTWDGLESGYKWTVAELNVPNGYVCTVNYYGDTAVITNTVVTAGLPQTGDGEMPYIGAMLVLAAMAIAVIIAGKERD